MALCPCDWDCVPRTGSVKQRTSSRQQPWVKAELPHWHRPSPIAFFSFYLFVSHKSLGRKLNWNCVHINMSQTEFHYSGSEMLTIERGSLWSSEYSLSKFIKLVVRLVMSKVPLTHVIPPLYVPGLQRCHGSLMSTYFFQEAISNFYLSTGHY